MARWEGLAAWGGPVCCVLASWVHEGKWHVPLGPRKAMGARKSPVPRPPAVFPAIEFLRASRVAHARRGGQGGVEMKLQLPRSSSTLLQHAQFTTATPTLDTDAFAFLGGAYVACANHPP